MYICVVDKQAVYHTIQKTVTSFLPDSRVWLFGSHARGDNDSRSDYDLLIITPANYSQKEKVNWSTTLDRAIVNAIHAPVDLLFYSEEEVLQRQQLPGHIIRSAMREGMAL